MKFYPVTEGHADETTLAADYKAAHAIGTMRIGQNALFFRSGMKTYYIPYSCVTRCFRRVVLVPARMCCGRGNLAVEHMVFCEGERELVQIQLPGEKAGKAALAELKTKIPGAVFTAPIEKHT